MTPNNGLETDHELERGVPLATGIYLTPLGARIEGTPSLDDFIESVQRCRRWRMPPCGAWGTCCIMVNIDMSGEKPIHRPWTSPGKAQRPSCKLCDYRKPIHWMRVCQRSRGVTIVWPSQLQTPWSDTPPCKRPADRDIVCPTYDTNSPHHNTAPRCVPSVSMNGNGATYGELYPRA